MKDRTNKEKPHLEQTIKGIGMMYESLDSLQERVFPQNPMWFAIMAQGAVDQIRDLLDDLEWLMEDMVPQPLREQVEPIEPAEQVTMKKAA